MKTNDLVHPRSTQRVIIPSARARIALYKSMGPEGHLVAGSLAQATGCNTVISVRGHPFLIAIKLTKTPEMHLLITGIFCQVLLLFH